MGKGKSSKTTTETKQSNWLADNKQYSSLVNQVISSSDNYQATPYQVAAMSSGEQSALQSLMQGQDYSGYQDAQEFYQNLGSNLVSSGQSGLTNAQSVLNKYQNMSQKDYQSMLQSEYDSDLVQDEISQATNEINKYVGSQVHSVNQNATASGNMGSSRAGVAEGVIRANAADTLSSTALSYRQAEEQNAANRTQTFMSNQLTAASNNASIAQNQLSTGLSSYGQGLNAYSLYQQGTVSNYQNAVNAGSILQQYNQSQLDVSRVNSEMAQNPALMRLMYINQGLGPIANYSTSGTNTTTQSSSGGSSVMGGVLGAVGTGVGAYFGGPIGASIGGSLGSAAGNAM
ncbi:hypothetical protein MXL54_08375 [Enterobacteriaceae bacterium G50]|nr:hypothetical protein [Enterobacteriaceae bacterium G50]